MKNRIKEYRKKSGLTQAGLALKLGAHQTTIASYESGRTEPDLATAKKLAVILGASFDELFICSDNAA